MNENQKFEHLARKVKLKRWLGTIILIIVLVPLVMLGYNWGTNFLVKQQSNNLNQKMNFVAQTMAPNIQSSDQILKDYSNTHGKVLSHRFKDIAGYRIPWGILEGNYTLSTNNLEINTVDTTAPTKYARSTPFRQYDRTTQRKIPLFYNERLQQASTTQSPHELEQVAQMSNYVAEVALTFKKPMTYRQIQAQLPNNLTANWYWLGVNGRFDASKADNNYVGIQAHNQHLSAADYRDFQQVLLTAPRLQLLDFLDYQDNFKNTYKPIQYAVDYAKKYPTLNQAKFSGIIVSGPSENFRQLKNADWISASSVGTTIKRVPYIQPEY